MFRLFVVNGLLTLTQRSTCSHCFRVGVRGDAQYVISPALLAGKSYPVQQRMIVAAARRHFAAHHPLVKLPTLSR